MSILAKSNTRRHVLTLLAAAFSTGPLGGCASWFRRPLVPVCPGSPDVSFPQGPLTIDSHCHVFNGSDLQVKQFLSMVAVKQSGALRDGAIVLGSILQDLAWSYAPDGEAELKELRFVAESLRDCDRTRESASIASLRQAGYTTGRQQLQESAKRSIELAPLRSAFLSKSIPQSMLLDPHAKGQLEAIEVIENLPADVKQYHATKASAAKLNAFSLRGRSATGLIDFVLQNFQYRYVSVHDYLGTYDEPAQRVVDLMMPSMVDYDWWLAKGSKTPTSMTLQVQVMEQISVLTGGRVHGFVAYDPLRQIAFDMKLEQNDPLAVVTEAIEQRGCIGVKLYPPMGFAVLGNEQVQRRLGLMSQQVV